MAKARIPQFGKWESEGNQPYTHYFNVARKEKIEGKIIMNPNDPEQNPESFEQEQHPKQKNVNIRAQSSYPPRSKPQRKASRDSIDSAIQSQQPPYRDFNRAKQHDENRSSLRSVPNTPDRSRALDQKGAAVPRFGDWENNPGAGEGYTHIFEKVRDDKQDGATTNGPSHKNTPKLVTSYEDKDKPNSPVVNKRISPLDEFLRGGDDRGCCCFEFFRK